MYLGPWITSIWFNFNVSRASWSMKRTVGKWSQHQVHLECSSIVCSCLTLPMKSKRLQTSWLVRPGLLLRCVIVSFWVKNKSLKKFSGYHTTGKNASVTAATDDMLIMILMMKLMTILPSLVMWLWSVVKFLTLGMNDDYEIILRL